MELILGATLISLAIILIALKNEIWRLFFLFIFFISLIIAWQYPNLFEIKQTCINQGSSYCLEYKTTYIFKATEILSNVWFWIIITFTGILFIYLILKAFAVI